MQRISLLIFVCTLLSGCDKDAATSSDNLNCDINSIYNLNASKLYISSGIYGTVSSMEGNCMPMIPPANNSCTHCPVSRTIRIHAYTRIQDATTATGRPGFYTQVNTNLIKEITTDKEGFFQTELTAGQYSLFILENGLLHAASTDGNGGLNPIAITTGKQKADLVMKYKASF
jgi:hypothetical protein